ncbi:mRNA polyadenylation-related protein [Trichosporon asahii var. asahii CBS 8904]|uniref:mRNA polyadenylation-related protein n=1 Tax=Trichosporon asahii var. asahii (strain CBS 8904) TaxID=1220162 RepID=K1VQR1_TRIAC|nr:mRNA polyadenylation-related protein [Trichosporon asahii var. asahii CBS 8904]
MTSMRGRGRGARGGPTQSFESAHDQSARLPAPPALPALLTFRRPWRGGGPPGSAGYRNAANASPRTNEAKLEDKGGKAGFQTDTDISASNRAGERELKPWVPDEPESNGGAATNGGARGDVITFGGPVSNIPWDQFETNTRLFGAKTDYDEELYTTKLDRSSPGYKKREREADRLANEILSKTSSNSHIAEERGQAVAGDTKDEEEKYSGVVRNPNAYVPPGARKATGGGLPVRKDGTTPPPAPKEAPAPASAPKPTAAASAPAEKETTTDVPLPPMPKGNGPASANTNLPTPQSSTPPPATASNNGPRLSADPVIDPAIASSSLGPGPATSMARSTSSIPQGQTQTQATTNGGTSPGGSSAAHAPAPIGAVVDQARQFVESERERVTARKQSMAKNERAHVLAEFKSWQAKFKVPLPIPKDILPILTKDEQKQKEIEEQAAKALKDAEENKKHAAATAKSPLAKPNPLSPNLNLPKPPVQAQQQPKKIVMKIPEIPPFRKKVPPAVPVPETASQNIAVTSPTPSNASVTSGHAKLNPNASSFVFKPNPSAAAFKPGDVTSPKAAPTKLSGPPSVGGPSTSPAPPPSVSPGPTASSSASATPKNPFYKDGPPKRIVVNPRDDFNPFKHGQVPAASSVTPQWPYTGRRSSVAYSQPMHPMAMQNYDGGAGGGTGSGDDPSSPHPGPPPMLQGGIPPNLLPFYRYQPNVNVPPQMQGAMMGQMFPGPGGFVPPQMQGSPHMQQGPQHGPNGTDPAPAPLPATPQPARAPRRARVRRQPGAVA